VTFIILTSNKPSTKPMLVRVDDISAVEPLWEQPGSRIILRSGNQGSIEVDNCVEDVINRVITAKEGKPSV